MTTACHRFVVISTECESVQEFESERLQGTINTGPVKNVSHLRRLRVLPHYNPALTHWANFCRASGAGEL